VGAGHATMIEGLAALLGMSSVSLLHSLLPTHWLPFSVVGRAHGWSLSKTLLISAWAPLTTFAARPPRATEVASDHAAEAIRCGVEGSRTTISRSLIYSLTPNPTTSSRATCPLRVSPPGARRARPASSSMHAAVHALPHPSHIPISACASACADGGAAGRSSSLS